MSTHSNPSPQRPIDPEPHAIARELALAGRNLEASIAAALRLGIVAGTERLVACGLPAEDALSAAIGSMTARALRALHAALREVPPGIAD